MGKSLEKHVARHVLGVGRPGTFSQHEMQLKRYLTGKGYKIKNVKTNGKRLYIDLQLGVKPTQRLVDIVSRYTNWRFKEDMITKNFGSRKPTPAIRAATKPMHVLVFQK